MTRYEVRGLNRKKYEKVMDVVFSRGPVGGRQFGHDRFRRAGSVPTGVHDPTAFKMNKSPLHEMTQRHNGTIKIDSAPGRGSTFRINLPAVAT